LNLELFKKYPLSTKITLTDECKLLPLFPMNFPQNSCKINNVLKNKGFNSSGKELAFTAPMGRMGMIPPDLL
jgi:hypothetical protein